MFLSGISTDVIWALYIRKSADKQRLAASLYGVGTGICSLISIKGIQLNFYSGLFWLVGLFLGNYYCEQIERTIKKYVKTCISFIKR